MAHRDKIYKNTVIPLVDIYRDKSFEQMFSLVYKEIQSERASFYEVYRGLTNATRSKDL
jgi:hypothetical protein